MYIIYSLPVVFSSWVSQPILGMGPQIVLSQGCNPIFIFFSGAVILFYCVFIDTRESLVAEWHETTVFSHFTLCRRCSSVHFRLFKFMWNSKDRSLPSNSGQYRQQIACKTHKIKSPPIQLMMCEGKNWAPGVFSQLCCYSNSVRKYAPFYFARLYIHHLGCACTNFMSSHIDVFPPSVFIMTCRSLSLTYFPYMAGFWYNLLQWLLCSGECPAMTSAVCSGWHELYVA